MPSLYTCSCFFFLDPNIKDFSYVFINLHLSLVHLPLVFFWLLFLWSLLWFSSSCFCSEVSTDYLFIFFFVVWRLQTERDCLPLSFVSLTITMTAVAVFHLSKRQQIMQKKKNINKQKIRDKVRFIALLFLLQVIIVHGDFVSLPISFIYVHIFEIYILPLTAKRTPRARLVQ